MKKTLMCLGASFVVALSANAMAADFTMKIAWAETADPFGHPASAAMYVFKDQAEALSGGKLEVKLYPTAQLGDAKAVLGQVKQGILQSCTSIPSGMIAGRFYKNLNILEIPYIFDNNIIAWRVLNSSTGFFRDLSNDIAQKAGIRPLAFFVEGQRHFTNNTRPLVTAKDMSGLKIRTMEVPAHLEMVKAFGATPTPISWTELYGALQTGVIDGQENPIGNILYAKLYEVQKYLTLDGHVTLINTWVVNEKWFAGLPTDVRKAIVDAASIAEISSRGLSQIKDTVGLKELETKGMKVTVPTPDGLASFRKTAQDKVVPYVRTTVDDVAWIDRLQSEVDKAKSY